LKKTNFKNLKLGKLAIGVIICILMLTTSVATTMGNFINTNEQRSANLNSLSYTFLFKEPVFKSMQLDSSEYTLIDIQGCMAAGTQAGEPQIPKKFISLLLPPKKTVSSINVVGEPVQILAPIDLIEKPIFPYQNPVPFGYEATQEFVINSNIYSSSNPYPSTIYTDYSIGYSHGYAILDLGLNPVQYTPSQGTITFYSELTVTINLANTDYINPLFQNNPEDESWVKKLVYNPELTDLYESLQIPTFEYPGGLCSPSESYDYVIITTEQGGLDYWEIGGTLTYNWDSLLEKHQTDDGLSGTLVTVQEINACTDYQGPNPFNDQQAHIREFCKDAYEDWGTRYVLIGGDGESNQIPARDMDTNYETDIDADIYWSNLDNNFNADQDNYWGESGDSGFDLYSDLFIGRVTCDTPQDVSNWLTKSFYYADSFEDTYIDNAAFYGGNTGWSCEGDDFMDYSAIKGTDDWLGPDPHHDGPFPTWAGFQYGFETWNADPIPTPDNTFDISVMWTAEPPNPGWQGGSETAAINGLKNDINNDLVTLISGIAHANPDMSLDVSSSAWESQYHNTKPFFLHDYGCHCGDFDDSDDGVLHSMLFHSDTELAFGVVYNTCYGWGNQYCTNSSSAFQAKEFWSYFLDMENKSEDFANWQLGKAHAFSKDRMAPTIATVEWDASYGTWRAIIQGCLLFGDPAQTIKTPHPSAPPEKPSTPVGKTTVVWFKNITYTSSTTEPDGEQIYYLFDWNDGSASEWLGPYDSGQIVTAHYSWSELGIYNVRVKAKDIWGAGSPWSDPLVVTVTDNNPPELPTIDGPTNPRPSVLCTYTINSTDLDGDQIRYYIDWGDGKSQWFGPYASGESCSAEHKWTRGVHTLKLKARDSYGDESDWAYLEVNTARNKVVLNPLLQHLLERFANLFPILKTLFF
jgi:hypothetical protein